MTLLLDRVSSPIPDIHDDATRREFIVGGVAAGLLVAAGCGSDEDQLDAVAPTTTEGDAAFPVTIEHKFGSTEIPSEPKRVVTVGLTDHDTVLALGVAPVGVYDWYQEYAHATHPWAQDELGDARPEIVSTEAGELNFEQIAALQPDVILGVNSSMSDQDYATLSAIAPTVSQSDNYEWFRMARLIGRALGRQERAEELVAEVESSFAKARRQYPEFVGATAAFAFGGEDGLFYAATSQTPRTQVLTGLGFVIPPEIDDLAGPSTIADVSAEQLGLFEQELVLWDALPAVVEDNELYQSLAAAREGRGVFLDDPVLSSAVVFATLLSLPFVLDALVPRLAAAIDGDPATPAF